MRYTRRMRYLLLIALAGCGPSLVVVKWTSTGTALSEHIEIKRSGDGNYTITNNGLVGKDERLVLTTAQVPELAELFLGQSACQLHHDPQYTPRSGEGQTTLELAFPDQVCKVVLWNTEWEHGRAQPITETMR